MDKRIRNFLDESIGATEADQVENFLNQSFCLNGQIAIASIFAFAQEKGIDFSTVMAQCQAEYERNWQWQHPDIKGDADAPGNAGIQNRRSLENIYYSCGIPSPISK